MISLRDCIYLYRYYRDMQMSLLGGLGVVSRDSLTPTYKRVIESRNRSQKICYPWSIVNPRRFDIAAKTMFARAYIEGNSSHWPEDVYKEHLRSWNNFFEDVPEKNTYDEFRESYISVIDSVKNGSMKFVESPVLIESNSRTLRNGAHRVAASVVLRGMVNTVEEYSTIDINWGADFFRGKEDEKPESVLDEMYIDAMTIEYVTQFSDNLFAVIVFPSASGHRDDCRAALEQMGQIVNYRSFASDYFDSRGVIRQIYYGEDWNFDGSGGLSDKAGWCFDGDGNIEVYIIQGVVSDEHRIEIKERLRDMWGIGKNSIHMTDTVDEVNLVARMFFHENTRQTLRRYDHFSPSTMEIFNKYRDLLPVKYVDRDNFCIDSSAVLDFFGIRVAADIDYIKRGQYEPINTYGVDEHMDEYVRYYTETRDAIITDPSNHFYYAGCKIASLDLVETMKENRSRSDPESRLKDNKDIDLIKRYRESIKSTS